MIDKRSFIAHLLVAGYERVNAFGVEIYKHDHYEKVEFVGREVYFPRNMHRTTYRGRGYTLAGGFTEWKRLVSMSNIARSNIKQLEAEAAQCRTDANACS